MKTVNQLLHTKGREVWSVTPGTSVFDALKLMADKNVGAVLVMEGSQLAGIFSERDYARKVILKGKSSKEMTVQEIMTEKVDCISLSQTVRECMTLMTEKHHRHLPVVDEERVVGMISIGDVVKAIISDQEFTIEQLESYITGSR
ncbi:MAG TPA: CBS domain-containing protein [Terriglobia bacterium]|nr:CBS domain-containing protein [Terriglobia bacterium]